MSKTTFWKYDYNLLDEFERPFLYCVDCKKVIHPTINENYKFCPICGNPKATKPENINTYKTEV